jgi:hypothetical protein
MRLHVGSDLVRPESVLLDMLRSAGLAMSGDVLSTAALPRPGLRLGRPSSGRRWRLAALVERGAVALEVAAGVGHGPAKPDFAG